MNQKAPAYIFLIIFIVLAVPACSSKKSGEKKPGSTAGVGNQAPSEANEIMKETNKIIVSLEKKMAIKKVPAIAIDSSAKQGQGEGSSSVTSKSSTGQTQGQSNNQAGQSGGQKKEQGTGQNQMDNQDQASGQNQQGQGSGQIKKGQTQDGNQNQQDTQPANKNTSTQQKLPNGSGSWQEETSSLKNILRNWNTLEPETVKAGLSVEARDKFEASLEQLSTMVGQQNLEASLMAAISLYRDFGEVARALSLATPPDLFLVKYEALAGITEAYQGNWKAADLHASQIDAHWGQLRMQLKDADTKLVDRTEFSLQDIKQAVKARSIELVALRGEIAINNLKELEDSISKGSQQSAQGQGGGSSQKNGSQGSGQGSQ